MSEEAPQDHERPMTAWLVRTPELGGSTGRIADLARFDPDFASVEAVARLIEGSEDEELQIWPDEFGGEEGSRLETQPLDKLRGVFAAINPATVKAAYAVVAAIAEHIRAGRAAAAEKEFREGVINRLDAILGEVRVLQRQVAELGVLLIERQDQIDYAQSLGAIQGALSVLQSNWPGYPRDRDRAKANFDSLQQALGAAARHGAAMTPSLALGFVSLLALLIHSEGRRERPAKLTALKRVWLRLFRDLLDPDLPGSLTAQRDFLSALVATAWKNISDIPRGRTVMGTHNYGTTRVFMVVQEATSPEWRLEIVRQEEQIPQPKERVDDVRGGRRHLFGSRPVAERTFSTGHLRETDIELLLYTSSEAALRRPLPHPASITGRFGGDRHGSFYDAWVSEMRDLVALNHRIRRKVEERLTALDESIKMAKMLAIFCES